MGMFDALKGKTTATDAAPVNDGLTSFEADLTGLSGLRNAQTGLGGLHDKARQGEWYFNECSQSDLECAYRSNWLARAVVDYPADDMIRSGFEFNEDGDACKELEARIDELGVMECVHEALINARLYGGSVIYLSDGAEDVSEPLNEGNIVFIRSLSCYEIYAQDIEYDFSSPNYGRPKRYIAAVRGDSTPSIHPSRVVRFVGREIPRTVRFGEYYKYGDSVLETVLDTIENAKATEQGIAALIQEARVDVYKVNGFMNKISNKLHESAFLARFRLVSRMKSINNSLILDGQDEYDQKQISFNGLPEIEQMFLNLVSGASDIPATRLLGQSPGGMNATGESDLRNYYDSILARQKRDLKPRLDQIFRAITGGVLPDYDFKPLWQMDEKDRSEINNRNALTTQIYMNTGLLDPLDLKAGVEARIAEDGLYPSFEPSNQPLPEDFNGGAE